MTRRITTLNSQLSTLEPTRLRRGFTLVEVLVVIAIIGMLVGLLLPAVMAAKTKAKMTVIKGDMTEIVNALENFKTSIGNGQYPPDGTNQNDLQQFCKAAWPRVNWVVTVALPNTSNQVPYPKFTPDTALCFWLGGAQDGPAPTVAAPALPHFIGFSANPMDPFDQLTPPNSPSQSRTPVILEFDKNRVNSSPTGNILVSGNSKSGLRNNTVAGSAAYYNLYQYFPPNGKDMTSGTYAPYVYYKAVPVVLGSSNHVYTDSKSVNGTQFWQWVETSLYKPGSTTILSCLPYYDSTTNPLVFVNPQPNQCQLLCPGLDGIYGATADNGPPKYPGGSNYNSVTGIDDMTNFTQGATVGNDMQ